MGGFAAKFPKFTSPPPLPVAFPVEFLPLPACGAMDRPLCTWPSTAGGGFGHFSWIFDNPWVSRESPVSPPWVPRWFLMGPQSGGVRGCSGHPLAASGAQTHP